MKKTKFFWLLPIMVIIFLASACASPTKVEEENDPENGQEQEVFEQILEFETLFQTSDSRHEEEMIYIIGDEETFTDLWINKLEKEEMFEINFDEKMVLAVFTGEKPSGGYNVEIIDIIETDNNIKVIAKETVPGEDDMVTMALTYPGHVILLDKNEKDIFFNIE